MANTAATSIVAAVSKRRIQKEDYIVIQPDTSSTGAIGSYSRKEVVEVHHYHQQEPRSRATGSFYHLHKQLYRLWVIDRYMRA